MGRPKTYAALDLGTNNCRLLVARPTPTGFKVIDAFSRIIRLGEGVYSSGALSDGAMFRTLDALRVCAAKISKNRVTRSQLVATEACRIAHNGPAFIERVRCELGMELEILTRQCEAGLAVSGCASLLDTACDYALIFDIGGGSTELIWINLREGFRDLRQHEALCESDSVLAWTSLPVGVVTLAEKFGGRNVTTANFEEMVGAVEAHLKAFDEKHEIGERIAGQTMHFLGTSGTVTTVAGIKLELPRYDRSYVDGCWLDRGDVRDVTENLLSLSYDERVKQPCIGQERADLVLAGCAILDALIRTWPTERLRVADRGLREGMLTRMMAEDGVSFSQASRLQ